MLNSGFAHRFHRNFLGWTCFCISRGPIGQGCACYRHNYVCLPLQIIVNGQSTVEHQLQLDLRLLNNLETVQVVRRCDRTTMLFVSFVALSCLCLCFDVDFATGRRSREKTRSFEVITRFGDHMFAKPGRSYAFDTAALHALCSRERNADESLIFFYTNRGKSSFRAALRAAKCHAATSVVAEFIAFISVS